MAVITSQLPQLFRKTSQSPFKSDSGAHSQSMNISIQISLDSCAVLPGLINYWKCYFRLVMSSDSRV